MKSPLKCKAGGSQCIFCCLFSMVRQGGAFYWPETSTLHFRPRWPTPGGDVRQLTPSRQVVLGAILRYFAAVPVMTQLFCLIDHPSRPHSGPRRRSRLPSVVRAGALPYGCRRVTLCGCVAVLGVPPPLWETVMPDHLSGFRPGYLRVPGAGGRVSQWLSQGLGVMAGICRRGTGGNLSNPGPPLVTHSVHRHLFECLRAPDGADPT